MEIAITVKIGDQPQNENNGTERGKKEIRGSLPEGLAPWRYSLTCVMEALSRPLAPKSATHAGGYRPEINAAKACQPIL